MLRTVIAYCIQILKKNDESLMKKNLRKARLKKMVMKTGMKNKKEIQTRMKKVMKVEKIMEVGRKLEVESSEYYFKLKKQIIIKIFDLN